MKIELLPEDELLLVVARRRLSDDQTERLRTLAGAGLDWRHLSERARLHRLLPLLYHHLSSVCPENVPTTIRDSWREECRTNAQQCLYLFSELRRVMRLFAEHDITAVVFKGPVLAAAVYGDIGLRQVGDLDILIETAKFKLAKEVLESTGYKMEPQLSASQESSHLHSHCEIQFISNAGIVDLHWGLTPKVFAFGLDSLQVLKRAVPITIQGTSLMTFSPEDMIHYLCFHGSKHYWSRLEWVSSLAEFIRSNQPIDWARLIAQAKESHSLRILKVGLLLAHDLCQSELPEFVLSDSKETEALRRCAAQFQNRIFARDSGALGAFEMFALNMQIMDRKRDAIAGLLRSILVPTISDWQAVSFSRRMHPVYYAFRPVRLLAKYARRDPG